MLKQQTWLPLKNVNSSNSNLSQKPTYMDIPRTQSNRITSQFYPKLIKNQRFINNSRITRMCAVNDPNIQKNDKSYLNLKEPLGNSQKFKNTWYK